MPRECAQCGERLKRDYFSTNQWRKGDGHSRCEDCVSQKSCPRDSDGNCIEDVAALVEYIVDKLKKSSTGMLAASELGGDIRRWSAWSSVIDNAGGLKLFLLLERGYGVIVHGAVVHGDVCVQELTNPLFPCHAQDSKHVTAVQWCL